MDNKFWKPYEEGWKMGKQRNIDHHYYLMTWIYNVMMNMRTLLLTGQNHNITSNKLDLAWQLEESELVNLSF